MVVVDKRVFLVGILCDRIERIGIREMIQREVS